MGKKAKEHRKKVAARNQKMKHQKRSIENAQRKFIMDLIEREKQAGAFNDNPTLINALNTDASVIVEGPQI
jgi:type II secretory pathway component PulC